jgi:hypothetical protein
MFLPIHSFTKIASTEVLHKQVEEIEGSCGGQKRTLARVSRLWILDINHHLRRKQTANSVHVVGVATATSAFFFLVYSCIRIADTDTTNYKGNPENVSGNPTELVDNTR